MEANMGIKRKGRTGAGWKKRRTLLKSKEERRKKNKDNVDSLKKKLDQWYDNCETPAAFLSFFNGEVTYYGNNSFMQSFCQDSGVLQRFSRYLRMQSDKDIEESLTSRIDIPRDVFQQSAHKKRQCIRELMGSLHQGRVNWTDESPEWWPSDVTFANPTGRHGFTSQQCDKVMHAFIEANVAYMEPDSPNLIHDTFEEEAVRFESDTESYILNISQTLSEYESWRENAKEVLRQCKRKLDTLEENAFVEPTTTTSSVEFWMRTQNSYYPYEPVQVLGGGNCLYRSVSKALFGSENKWDLIKLVSLSYLKSNTDAVLQYLNDVDSRDLLSKFGFGDVSNPADLQRIYITEVEDAFREGRYTGVLELFGSACFTECKIQLHIPGQYPHYKHLEGAYSLSTEHSWATINIMATAASPDSAAINHYVPLMRLDSFAGEFNLICCAKEHCKVLNVGQTFQCNLCGLSYHIDCVFPNLLHREFSFALRCGCDVKVMDEGLRFLESTQQMKKFFQTKMNTIAEWLINNLQVSVKCQHFFEYRKKMMGCNHRVDKFTGWVQTLNRSCVDITSNFLQSLVRNRTELKCVIGEITRKTEELIEGYLTSKWRSNVMPATIQKQGLC